VKRIALALWELPQNILGAALYQVCRLRGIVKSTEHEEERFFVEVDSEFAVSLGWFVFWSGEQNTRWFRIDRTVRAHEYGHTFQSKMLGPLYLPLVGVPSVMRNVYAFAYREITGRRWTGYFDGYPENWADRLGGVDRTKIKAEQAQEQAQD